MIFLEKIFSYCILLTDQIPLSDCLYFSRYWEICVLQLFVNQAVTPQNLKLNFLFKPFRYMTKKSRQKLEYLENEKSFWCEIKSIFHHFQRAFSCQRLSQTWECAFNFKISGVITWFINNCNTHTAHFSRSKGNQTITFSSNFMQKMSQGE